MSKANDRGVWRDKSYPNSKFLVVGGDSQEIHLGAETSDIALEEVLDLLDNDEQKEGVMCVYKLEKIVRVTPRQLEFFSVPDTKKGKSRGKH